MRSSDSDIQSPSTYAVLVLLLGLKDVTSSHLLPRDVIRFTKCLIGNYAYRIHPRSSCTSRRVRYGDEGMCSWQNSTLRLYLNALKSLFVTRDRLSGLPRVQLLSLNSSSTITQFVDLVAQRLPSKVRNGRELIGERAPVRISPQRRYTWSLTRLPAAVVRSLV